MSRECNNGCHTVMTLEKVIKAIKGGHHTSREIAEDVGIHQTTAKRNLTKMYNAGHLTRYKKGQAYIYEISNEESK